MHPRNRLLRKLFATPRVRGVVITVALFALGVGFTAIADRNGWDLAWTGYCFTPGGISGGWTHARVQPWKFLYDYGEIPGILLFMAAVSGYVGAKAGKIQKSYAGPCMVVILTIVLGPGIIVNGVLKNYWGRPRPAEVSIFDGDWEYHKVSEPGTPGRGKSFPCGHCSMAFALASGAAFYPLHATLARASLVGGIGYGLVMGAARLAQGGHFPTDVVWTGVLILMIVAVLHFLVFRIPETEENQQSPSQMGRYPAAALITLFLVIPGLAFLFLWPLYDEQSIPVTTPSGIRNVTLSVSPATVIGNTLAIPNARDVHLQVVKRGFGAPWARIRHQVKSSIEGATLRVYYEAQPTGYFSEWSAQATLVVPVELGKADFP